LLDEIKNSASEEIGLVQDTAVDSKGHFLKVLIDKIAMTIALSPSYLEEWGENMKKQIIANAIALEKKELDGGHANSCMGISAGPRGAYKVGFRIHPELVGSPCDPSALPHGHLQSGAPKFEWNECALVQVAPRSPESAHFVRIEWNPSKCGPGFWHRIKTILNEFVMVAIDPDFTTLTRLDIAVDLTDIRIGDFAWEARKKRCRALYMKAGTLETVYCGKKRENCVVIYDKAAELKLSPETSLTRAEIRLRPQKKPKDWGSIENPFYWIKVRDVVGANLAMSVADKIAFLDSVQQRGLARALLARSSAHRKPIREAIEMTAVPFWDPELFWKLAEEKFIETFT
jgi:hypothetical protein